MFAYSPFGSATFGSLGQSGPAFVSSSMTALGTGLMDAYANWNHTTISQFMGGSFYDARFQLLRDSAVLDKGVGNLYISASAYMNSVLEAKGYGKVVYDFAATADFEFAAQGVSNADFAPGYKMYSEALMQGQSSFVSITSGMFQTSMVAKGLATMQFYTAYKHNSQVSFRGSGTVLMSGGRALYSMFSINGTSKFNIVALYPGDDEADFYAKGLSTFLPRGMYTFATTFLSYGSSTAVFFGNALYQSMMDIEGIGLFFPTTATKYSSAIRVQGLATAVFNTQFAKVMDSLITAAGKGLFNPKFNFYGTAKALMYGIASADFKTEFAKVEATTSRFTGVATFRAYFLANAITSTTMIGVGTFKINTLKVLNSYSLFKGVGSVNFKPGNPLYASLPPAEVEFEVPVDEFHDLIWTDDMHIGKVTKQPVERKDYDIDFKTWLFQRDTEDTLNGVDYTVKRISGCGEDTNPLEVDLLQITTTTAKCWITGGTHMSTYKVEITVNTVRGRIDQSELIIFVEDL